MNLDTCILSCAAAILEILKVRGPQKFDALLAGVKQRLGEEARFRFGLGLDFLFLLGLIEYFEESDTFLLLSRAES